jgi:hypothetical protein
MTTASSGVTSARRTACHATAIGSTSALSCRMQPEVSGSSMRWMPEPQMPLKAGRIRTSPEPGEAGVSLSKRTSWAPWTVVVYVEALLDD